MHIADTPEPPEPDWDKLVAHLREAEAWLAHPESASDEWDALPLVLETTALLIELLETEDGRERFRAYQRRVGNMAANVRPADYGD